MTIGILALQGGVSEHRAALDRLGVDSREIREKTQLQNLDALIIPGGESTAFEKLSEDLFDELKLFVSTKPTLGTCAGMIFIAKSNHQKTLGLLDIEIERNAYGSQLDSFISDVDLSFSRKPFEGVFIRAPRIDSLGGTVEVLARTDDNPVGVRQGNLVTLAFHPELTDDLRVHEYFCDIV